MRIREQRAAAARRGFTLMEMLVVVAIIVVLAGASVPLYLRYLDDAKVSRARVDCVSLAKAAEAYKVKYGDFPASLAVLAQPPADGGTPYLASEHLLDPWGREYQYAPQGPHNGHLGKPDVWSLGPRMTDPNSIVGNWGAGQ